MKNLTPLKHNNKTLSLKILELRYKAARANNAHKLFIDDINKTNDVKHWLTDKKQRGWINVYGSTIFLKQ